MALYVLMIRDENIEAPNANEAEQQAMFERFVRWTEGLQRRGVLKGVEKLKTGGRTLRKRAGAVAVDGPFVETKEQVLGFFLIEAASFEEAQAIGGTCPGLEAGATLELREVDAFPKPGLTRAELG